MMHGRGESDSAIVAAKPTNKAGQLDAELVERRAGAEGNASQQSTHRAQYRVRVSQALGRIRHVARISRSAVHTRGGSRMPELGKYGSVRGARGNSRPYRDQTIGWLKSTFVRYGPKADKRERNWIVR